LKHPTTLSYEMPTESYYDSNDIKEGIKSRFEGKIKIKKLCNL